MRVHTSSYFCPHLGVDHPTFVHIKTRNSSYFCPHFILLLSTLSRFIPYIIKKEIKILIISKILIARARLVFWFVVESDRETIKKNKKGGKATLNQLFFAARLVPPQH